MARFSRSRTSRTVVSTVVIAIAVGAAFEFHRVRHSTAVTPPPLQMSVTPTSGAITLSKPITPVATPPTVNTLISQTPDPAKPQGQPVKPVIAATPAKVVTAPQTISASNLISDANAKVAAGDLLGARTQLNSALLSGSLSPVEIDAVKKQMSDINQTVVFSPRQFPKDPLGGVYVVKAGDRMANLGTSHSIPYELLLPLNRMADAKKLRYGQVLKIINGPFHVIVSKSKFTLDVYLGAPGGPESTYITTYPVGLGTDNSTPTGTWSIKNKVTHPAYFPPEGHAGGILAPEDPKNPLGAYWMGLEGTDGQAVGQRSYGIHGTIDPSSIGKQSSMGCIRLKNEDVEWVYKLLVVSKEPVHCKRLSWSRWNQTHRASGKTRGFFIFDSGRRAWPIDIRSSDLELKRN